MKPTLYIFAALIVSTLLFIQPSIGQTRAMTLYPDSISTTSAVLRGWINPAGATGEVMFYWSVASQYPNTPLSAGTISSSGQVEVRKRIEGLTPNVLYAYRVAWLGPNPNNGGELGFRTIADSSHVGYANFLAMFGGTIGNEIAFGIHTQATYCVDRNLGEDWIPPPGPQGVPDFRFIDAHGFNSQCMDQGILLDLRSYRGSAQIDTYKVRLDPGFVGYPAQISWSDMTHRYSGDIRLRDISGTVINVDMKAQNSVLVDEPITTLLIIATGPLHPSIMLSTPDENTQPRAFVLSQNYPNPFNPSTSIAYEIASRSFVSLKVFDVLGREVATLVNEQKDPGNYSTRLDASRLTSGVYFYRLNAGTFSGVRKLLLLK